VVVVFVVVTAVCQPAAPRCTDPARARVNGLVAGLYLLMLATTGLQLFWFRDIQRCGGADAFYRTAALTLVVLVDAAVGGEPPAGCFPRNGAAIGCWRTLGGFPRAAMAVAFGIGSAGRIMASCGSNSRTTSGHRFKLSRLGDSMAMVSLLLMSLNRRRLEALLAIIVSERCCCSLRIPARGATCSSFTAPSCYIEAFTGESGAWGLARFVSCGNPAGVSRPHPSIRHAFERMSVLVFDPMSMTRSCPVVMFMQDQSSQAWQYLLTGRSWQNGGDGGAGAYAHNWLSFLVAYGCFPPFVLRPTGRWLPKRHCGWEGRETRRPGCLSLLIVGRWRSCCLGRTCGPYIWLALASAACAGKPSAGIQNAEELQPGRAPDAYWRSCCTGNDDRKAGSSRRSLAGEPMEGRGHEVRLFLCGRGSHRPGYARGRHAWDGRDPQALPFNSRRFACMSELSRIDWPIGGRTFCIIAMISTTPRWRSWPGSGRWSWRSTATTSGNTRWDRLGAAFGIM